MDKTGSALGTRPTMRTVLHAKESIEVGAAYEELLALRPNVIFSPRFGMANVYVATNTGVAPDWTHAAPIEDLQPIVNNLWKAYMPADKDNWSGRPIADILVRMPGPQETFGGSRYMVVRRNYRPEPGLSTCGANEQQSCTLRAQLAEASALEGLGVGPDFDAGTADWTYASPAERLVDAISPNSGDIVLLANGRWYYQFGEPDRAQHGSLTFKDALVPMAFGFPTATGDAAKDDMLAPILEMMKNLPAQVPACSGEPQHRVCIEAQTLERFFIVPSSQ